MFPTCVGMNRLAGASRLARIDVPHMRGDEPNLQSFYEVGRACSPHAWG